MLIKKLQDEGKLQKLSKDQQKLTAEQNQLLMDGGKLEQQAQVRPQRSLAQSAGSLLENDCYRVRYI